MNVRVRPASRTAIAAASFLWVAIQVAVITPNASSAAGPYEDSTSDASRSESRALVMQESWSDADHRKSLHLATDDDALRRATSGPSERWGFALNDEEEERLVARADVIEDLASAFESLAEEQWYAGTYFDHKTESLVLLASEGRGQEAEGRLRLSLSPAQLENARVEERRFSYRALQDAFLDLSSKGIDGLDVIGAAIDEKHNELIVFANVDGPRPSSVPNTFAGISIDVYFTARDEPACSSRDNCSSPYRAGIRSYENSGGGDMCTMGFHIVVGSDKQYLTAGHCAPYNDVGTWWYHNGGGIGGEKATLWPDSNRDAMRVDISTNSQASNLVYGEWTSVANYRAPIQDEAICASRGSAQVVDCGMVAWASTYWTDSLSGKIMYGSASSGIGAIGGDSGAPIYVRNSYSLTAVGILNTLSTNNTRFAKMNEVMTMLGASGVS